MITHKRGGRRLSLKGFGLLLGISVLSSTVAVAQDSVLVDARPSPLVTQPYTGIHLFHGPESFGTLGYGPPGLHSGEQGFGLGYHLGYGYGGDALGVGTDGGYPFYGGPGYPHCNPQLRRIGGIVPFAYFGGPGYPTPDHPNFYGGGGPVVPDRPVVSIVTESGQPVRRLRLWPLHRGCSRRRSAIRPVHGQGRGGCGIHATDALASSPAGAVRFVGRGNSTNACNKPDGGTVPQPPRARQFLGIEAEPAVDSGGVQGMKITKVNPGSAAARVGLHEGDVIRRSTTMPRNCEAILSGSM